ncbi:GNAT family N-acetyltransferase [Kitasatospora sp. NPDC054939]
MEPTTLQPVTPELHPLVERLAGLYWHDMSEFLGHLPDAEGRYTFRPLPRFLHEPDRDALVIRYGDRPAGFALTRRMAEDPDGRTSIGAFFVVRALRRHGVGRQAALQLLHGRPGRWGIAFQDANPGAARFWRRIADEAVGAAWREEKRPVPATAPAGTPPDTWILLDTSGVRAAVERS